MKRLATAFAAIALIGTPAFAADMAVKAPPSPPPVPVYNWTGWYVGGNVGASFGTFKTDFNAAPVTVVVNNNSSFTTPAFAGRDEVYPGGFVGGGQIGYNWQFSPIWVVGVEADFQGADEKEHSTLTSNFSGLTTGLSSFEVTGTTALDYQAKIEWFGTARVRAGYLFGDGAVLTYVTGGLAYGKVDVEGTGTVSATVAGVPFSVTHNFSHNDVNIGWVVGSGTEGKLLIPGWTYKIEGLYMDLGHLDATGVLSGASVPPIFTVTGGQTTTHTHFTDTILRAGLNYQFH